MLSSLVDHQPWGFYGLHFEGIARFKCLSYKAVSVFFCSSAKLPERIKKIFIHIYSIYSSKTLTCIGTVKINFFS